MPKSFSQHLKDTMGGGIEANVFAEKCGKFFSFEQIQESEDSVKFFNILMNEDVEISATRKLPKGSRFAAIQFNKHGYMNIYESESDMLTYTVMQNPLFSLPAYQGATEFSAPSNNLTVVQQECVLQISNMVNAVKKLTLSDAQSLKAILGPTVEERILRSVIDAVVFDNPQSSGTANGV